MRRINGQFDGADQDYRVEKLVTVSGFVEPEQGGSPSAGSVVRYN